MIYLGTLALISSVTKQHSVWTRISYGNRIRTNLLFLSTSTHEVSQINRYPPEWTGWTLPSWYSPLYNLTVISIRVFLPALNQSYIHSFHLSVGFAAMFTTGLVFSLLPVLIVAQYGGPVPLPSTSAAVPVPSAPPDTPATWMFVVSLILRHVSRTEQWTLHIRVDVAFQGSFTFHPASFTAPNNTQVTFWFPLSALSFSDNSYKLTKSSRIVYQTWITLLPSLHLKRPVHTFPPRETTLQALILVYNTP